MFHEKYYSESKNTNHRLGEDIWEKIYSQNSKKAPLKIGNHMK